jgi:hypothetical protein
VRARETERACVCARVRERGNLEADPRRSHVLGTSRGPRPIDQDFGRYLAAGPRVRPSNRDRDHLVWGRSADEASALRPVTSLP